MKKRYAIVGASGRALYMFAKPIVEELADCAEVVGLFDPNSLRSGKFLKLAGLSCPIYTDFDQMLTEQKPDSVIIASIDRTHHEYIIRTLETGIDAISEKPMTVDADKCNAILEAEKRAGRKIVVTFNCRFMPYMAAVKQAIVDGLVGDVLSVNYEYLLDTKHGADYFRRWHRQKANSGGLLVHKSTHHFDLANWWIDDEPVDVMAYGTRKFYGPTRSERGERCLTCKYKASCEYYFDIEADPVVKDLYLDCESVDGYIRDCCVFSEEIDIEDSMSVNVKYVKGALLNYSLIAHSPYEGYRVTISGTDGRLEMTEYYIPSYLESEFNYFDHYDRDNKHTRHSVSKCIVGHSGGDDRLRQMVFRPGAPDPLSQQADSYAGALSILIGIAGNESIKFGRNIILRDMVPLDNYRG